MATLDEATLKKLTLLSRIACTEEEQKEILADLSKILLYVEQLEEVDTKGVPPCNHVLAEIVNVMREDVVGKTLPRATFLANAPEHVGGLIKVPTVINKE
jgi:aspartyl-tRNA(Asn)/glutamyl-tRNA(Gln) amidotransferase subunit C